jgi:hypothetical protein
MFTVIELSDNCLRYILPSDIVYEYVKNSTRFVFHLLGILRTSWKVCDWIPAAERFEYRFLSFSPYNIRQKLVTGYAC